MAERAAEALLRVERCTGLDQHQHERPGQVADPRHRVAAGLRAPVYHVHAGEAGVEVEARLEVAHGQREMRDTTINRAIGSHGMTLGRSGHAPR